MPKSRFLIALCLTLLTACAIPLTQADELATPRLDQWAQPINEQYNLYQMSPTLYRSALPDEAAKPLLAVLHWVRELGPSRGKRKVRGQGVRQQLGKR